MNLLKQQWLVVTVLVSAGRMPGDVETTPYAPTGNQYQFMTEYLEPASDVIWGSAGAIITEEGEIDLQPTTDEGWLNVVHAATVVAEGGNLMMMPGLANGESDWNEYAQGLTRAALLAKSAAEAQDAEALFSAGGAIHNVCRACHNKYMEQDALSDQPWAVCYSLEPWSRPYLPWCCSCCLPSTIRIPPVWAKSWALRGCRAIK